MAAEYWADAWTRLDNTREERIRDLEIRLDQELLRKDGEMAYGVAVCMQALIQLDAYLAAKQDV